MHPLVKSINAEAVLKKEQSQLGGFMYVLYIFSIITLDEMYCRSEEMKWSAWMWKRKQERKTVKKWFMSWVVDLSTRMYAVVFSPLYPIGRPNWGAVVEAKKPVES
jgi:hypothetical protein